jgi:hypothetical protein
MNQYAGDIYNYHNFAACASDSGLFAFKGDGSSAKPQLLGSYTDVGERILFLVR